MALEHGTAYRNDSPGTALSGRFEYIVPVGIWPAKFKRLNRYLQRPSDLFVLLERRSRTWSVGIPKHGDSGNSRNDLLEQFKSLAAQFPRESCYTRNVSAWLRQAIDDSSLNGVIAGHHHYRNGCGQFFNGTQ